MIEIKNAIVIDETGAKVDFVLAEVADDGICTPLYYTLKPNEILVLDDVETALSLLKPRWNGTQWTETASPEEIEAAHPQPISPVLPGDSLYTQTQRNEFIDGLMEGLGVSLGGDAGGETV